MYKIEEQKVQLQVDFQNERIEGRTRITLLLAEPLPSILSLFAKHITISSVSIDNNPVSYDYCKPEAQAFMMSKALSSTRSYRDWLLTNYSAYDYENEIKGFLKITLPKSSLSDRFINIDILFFIESPLSGARFYSYKDRNYLLTDFQFENKRNLFPCIDTLHSKYKLTWDIIVPQNYYVISSGELIGAIPDSSNLTFIYECNDLYIDTLGFCVCQADVVLPDPKLQWVTHFVGREEDRAKLEYTVSNYLSSISAMHSFISEVTNKSFPFKSLKVVYLDNIDAPLSFAGLCILPTETLLNAKIHEKRSENIGQIVHALSGNWAGCYMRMHSWADVWLILGLQKYLANSYVGERINSNEMRFSIKKQNAEYCKFVSQGLEIRPLFSQFFSSPNELLNDQVYMIKAPLILHMIEAKVGKVHLQSVIHKLPNLNCATDQFVKSFKKQCGISLKDFAKIWIYGTGAPQLECSFAYNRKNHSIDFNLKQQPLFSHYLFSPINTEFESINEKDYNIPLRLNSMRFYKGPLTIIAYETDSFEIDSSQHIIQVEGENFYASIPCKKRIRRPTNVKRREETEEEKKYRLTESPLLWVRVDPDYEILRKIHMSVDVEMWQELLKKEKDDTVGLYEAMKYIKTTSASYEIITNLNSILESNSYWYGVRMQAAKTLAALSQPINAHKGLDLLLYYYKRRHFERDVLKPNNFSSYDEYMIDKAVLSSIISVQDMSLTHKFTRIRCNSNFVIEFIGSLFRDNDNTGNIYDDCYWRSKIIEVISNTTNPIYVEEILRELYRQLRIDLVMKSENYCITQACLRGFDSLYRKHNLEGDMKFREYTEDIFKYKPSYPIYIQVLFLIFQLNLQFLRKNSLQAMLDTVLHELENKRQHPEAFKSCFYHIISLLLSSPDMISRSRQDSNLQSFIWDTITSPYSSLIHSLKYPLASIYKILYGFDWSYERKDPEWLGHYINIEGSGGEIVLRIGQSEIKPIDTARGNWVDWAGEILDRLMAHGYSEPFLEPVDFISLGILDYPQIIKNPMDLGTVKVIIIQRKLQGGHYGSFSDFRSDVTLVFDNCRLYNETGCPLYNYAEEMDSYFQALAQPIVEKVGDQTESDIKLKIKIEGSEVKIKDQ